MQDMGTRGVRHGCEGCKIMGVKGVRGARGTRGATGASHLVKLSLPDFLSSGTKVDVVPPTKRCLHFPAWQITNESRQRHKIK